jgi:uncharacterized protein YgiM (DUF1202 family)
MNKTRLAIFIVLLLAIAAPAFAGDAAVSYTIDCRGFRSSGGTLTLNRDNTGAQQEAYVISAIDGSGQTIFEPAYDVFFVGTTVQTDAGLQHFWSQSPRYNPLTLQVVSPAGNGLGEQIILQTQGNCAGLPSFSPIDLVTAFYREAVRRLSGEAFVVLPADGATDMPVQLNTAPPRPINPPGLPREQVGWAIVNTDNLSFRSGDSPFYEVIGVIDGGTELIVLGRNEDRNWWYVQVGGLRGWVKGEFLILRGDLTDAPIVPVTGALAQPRLYVGWGGNPSFTLPLDTAAIACPVPGNQDYAIIGRTSNTAYYEIILTCGDVATIAWIPAEFGIFRNPGGLRVPITYP